MDLKTTIALQRKSPEDCESLEEIRTEIDAIDIRIMELFSERHKYVEQTVRFKHDKDSVIAGERKKQVIGDRRAWAEKNGLNAETFAKIYSILIESNIQHELGILNLMEKEPEG